MKCLNKICMADKVFIFRIYKSAPVKVTIQKMAEKFCNQFGSGPHHLKIGKSFEKKSGNSVFHSIRWIISFSFWHKIYVTFALLTDMTSHPSLLTRRGWVSSRSRRTVAWVSASPTTMAWTPPTTRGRPSQPAPRTASSLLTMKLASSLWKDFQIR